MFDADAYRGQIDEARRNVNDHYELSARVHNQFNTACNLLAALITALEPTFGLVSGSAQGTRSNELRHAVAALASVRTELQRALELSMCAQETVTKARSALGTADQSLSYYEGHI